MEQQVIEEQKQVFKTCTKNFDTILILFAFYHLVFAMVYLCNYHSSPQPFEDQDLAEKPKKSKSKQIQGQSSFLDVQRIMHISGLMLTSYTFFHLYNDKPNCFNYVHLSMVWITLEILTYYLWIGAHFVIGVHHKKQRKYKEKREKGEKQK